MGGVSSEGRSVVRRRRGVEERQECVEKWRGLEPEEIALRSLSSPGERDVMKVGMHEADSRIEESYPRQRLDQVVPPEGPGSPLRRRKMTGRGRGSDERDVPSSTVYHHWN